MVEKLGVKSMLAYRKVKWVELELLFHLLMETMCTQLLKAVKIKEDFSAQQIWEKAGQKCLVSVLQGITTKKSCVT